MRLIDADALKEVVRREMWEPWAKGMGDSICKMLDHADEYKIAPLIHCKDCKYAHMTYDGYTKYCDFFADAYDEYAPLYLEPGSYCSYGERKDEKENETD